MWREMNIFGIYLPPMLAYLGITTLLFLPARWLMVRFRLLRWLWNPRLAEAGLFVCILGALVALL